MALKNQIINPSFPKIDLLLNAKNKQDWINNPNWFEQEKIDGSNFWFTIYQDNISGKLMIKFGCKKKEIFYSNSTFTKTIDAIITLFKS